jgi:hypothetical protein
MSKLWPSKNGWEGGSSKRYVRGDRTRGLPRDRQGSHSLLALGGKLTSFPKQETEFWTQPNSLCESAKLDEVADHDRKMTIWF